LLLADMVKRGELTLSDPVAKYLPSEVKVPERAGRSITLLDLSTHTSGLPRLPSNLQPRDLADPYADYTVERLYQFLSTYQLAPNFILNITHEDDKLFVQATGQPKFQIFPSSEREFFLKVVDVQITFETDSTGRAVSLTLHQNGAKVAGKRVP